MKKFLMLILLALSFALCLNSCGKGKVDDTDGFIGNEENEIKDDANDIKNDVKDGVDDVVDGAKDAADDVKDAVDGDNKNNSASDDGSKKSSASISDVIGTSASGRINMDQAKNAALSDAGVAAKEATFYKSYLQNDNGREYYDIAFRSSGSEYDYEIDAYTGQVLDRQVASGQ